MDIAYSINDIPIRLTRERWFHITENHDDLAGYYDDVLHAIEDPDMIIQGYGGAHIAMKGMGKKRYLGVITRNLVPKKTDLSFQLFLHRK